MLSFLHVKIKSLMSETLESSVLSFVEIPSLKFSGHHPSDEHIKFMEETSKSLSPVRDISTDPIQILCKKDATFSVSKEVEDFVKELLKNATEMEIASRLGYDTSDYQYMLYAGRIVMKNVCKNAADNVIDYVKSMYHILNDETKTFMLNNAKVLQVQLDKYNWCNYKYDYFSASLMHESYLARPKRNLPPAETPCIMYMRVAVQERHTDGVDAVISCFKDYIKGYATPASPTLFNAGFIEPQMSSCFIFKVGDNMKSIQKSNYVIGMVSASGGGLGGDVSEVRAEGSVIRYRGTSKGLIPMIKMYSDNVKYVKQGAQRNGAMTVSCRTHHRDIMDFVSLLDNKGDHNARTPDLNIALWTSWLFWDRVREGGNWSLFCPKDTPELNRVYGKEFERRYKEAEKNLAIPRKTIKAMDLLLHAITIQRLSGKPYIMHGDSANFKSPHNHIGYISSSNLCLEIIEYTDENNINVCNLKSINLAVLARDIYRVPPKDLDEALSRINISKLMEISRNLVLYLNRVIDNNFYPLDEDDGETLHRGPIHKTNMRFRSLGIGVSGLAELFASLDISYVSDLAGEIDKLLFACIYFNTLASSVQMAIYEGKCEVFDGSSYSQGKLQFDLWREEYLLRWCSKNANGEYDPNVSRNPVMNYDELTPVDPSVWKQERIVLKNRFGDIVDVIEPTYQDLKRVIMKHGMRNSLLMAPMPTASTAKTFRNSESCEPHIGNIYAAKLLAGSFPVMNRFMYFDLCDIGLWNDRVKEYIIANNGKLTGISEYLGETNDRLKYLEEKYLTMYEISQQLILFRAMRRGIYIDQSQSTSVFIEEPDNEKLIALHNLTDYLGLKTGMYYLRTRSTAETTKFTVNPLVEAAVKKLKTEITPYKSVTSIQEDVCRMEDGCLMCGS